MAAYKAHETGTTCPNCQTYFAHVEIERDGDQAYAILEVTACAECGAMLCKCCSQFACDGCGHAFCSEHAHVSGDAQRPDRFCTACELEAVAGEQPARCPECLGVELVCVPYDFGTDPGTGYRESGERFECRACGATGDASEVLTHELPAAKPMGRETAVPKICKTQTA